MTGVSTESLGKVEEVLAKNTSTNPLELADELFAAVTALDNDGSLRRALTDTSRQSAAREGIAKAVFGSKVLEQTLAVLTVAVAQRWSIDEDLTNALEKSAVLATVASARQHRGPQGPEQTVNELLVFVRNVTNTPEAQAALTNSTASVRARQKLARDLGGQDLSPESALLLQRIGGHNRSQNPVRVAEQFIAIIMKQQEQYLARVTSATALSQEQLDRLGAALNKLYDRQLKLDVSVDPAILGGLRVQVGDEVIDGTVISRLDRLERHLD